MEANALIDLAELRAVLEDFAEAAAKEYAAQLDRDGRRASGLLEDRIETIVRAGDREYIVALNLQDYWKYVENGTRGRKTGNPGRKFPPVNNILEWVNVKPNLPRPAGISPEQFARKVAGKIYWYGTEGKPSLATARAKTIAEWRAKISAALGHDMTNYIRKVVATE